MTRPGRSTTNSRSASTGSEVMKIGWSKLPIGLSVSAAAPLGARRPSASASPRMRARRSTAPLSDAGMADLGRVWQIQVEAAARADLDVELHRLVAVRALAFRFVPLAPVENHRDQSE